MIRHRFISRLLLLALIWCSTGCAIQVKLTLPDEFLEMDSSPTHFKATSADDAILWVERVSVQKSGEKLKFWVDALKNDFVENRGYTLLSAEDSRTDGGNEGTQLLFEATAAGATYRYLVTMFMAEGPSVYVSRFTAEKDTFAKHLEAIKTSVRSLQF